MRTPTVPFGRAMRDAHFSFDEAYTPLNHGSFGALPIAIRDHQRKIQELMEAKPDTFIRYTIPQLLDESRAAVGPLLGVSMDEVVFVPNATTAINTVLRNLVYEKGDVILYFSTIYPGEKNTILYICETTQLESVCIELEYPMQDNDILHAFLRAIRKVGKGGRHVKIALFDTVSTFPGVRIPWEALVAQCKTLGIFSLIDGAHGIGHLDLTMVGELKPDFFTSNCYKWLYTPRGCAIFYVPAHNQHLIRSTVPTSHGFQPVSDTVLGGAANSTPKAQLSFPEMFAHVATIDTTPYICVAEALRFRDEMCGGEQNIRRYCRQISYVGAHSVAQILGTGVMDNGTSMLTDCCFANVRLPLTFTPRGSLQGGDMPNRQIYVDEAPKIGKWITERTIFDFDTMVPAMFHAGSMWVRFSGQIYVEIKDFEWAGYMLKELCERVVSGEGRA